MNDVSRHIGTKALMRYVGATVALLYVFTGATLIMNPSVFTLNETARNILGIVLISYGVLRFYRSFRRSNKTEDL